jgi:glutathione S-transferase
MKLRHSYSSPYVRKAMITALEAGLDDEIELLATNPWAADTDLPNDNPLCKVPALITDGGEHLFDSPVICEYLDGLHDGAKIFPAAGGARWTALRRQALADGILDAAVALRVETVMRPAELQWTKWTERQTSTINRALDALEDEAAAFADLFTIGEITVVSALGYLDFRFHTMDWRSGRPRLAAWCAKQASRPSVAATIPHD